MATDETNDRIFKAQGSKEYSGPSAVRNAMMLTMCTELGFHVTDDPNDRGVKLVTLPVCTEHQ